MNRPKFYTAGDTQALRFARSQLLHWGYEVSPAPSDTTTHVLLPVPSLETDGRLKGGGKLEDVLKALPQSVTVLGGNLPSLPCRFVDFLRDEFYLEENAGITAQCTMGLIAQHRENIAGLAVLVIGWGRIGKRLAPMLHASGANVTVASRKTEAAAYPVVETGKWNARQYDIIINTAPAAVLEASEAAPHALLIDLASAQGICGSGVIWARGLPNKDMPGASGILMAKTALRYALGKE